MAKRRKATGSSQVAKATQSERSAAEDFESLPPHIQAALKQDPKTAITLIQSAVRHSSYQGPWLPPEFLEGYESIVPGSGREVVDLIKKQVEHRHLLESEDVKATNIRLNRGQLLGWVISLVVSAMSIGAAAFIKGWPGIHIRLAQASSA